MLTVGPLLFLVTKGDKELCSHLIIEHFNNHIEIKNNSGIIKLPLDIL